MSTAMNPVKRGPRERLLRAAALFYTEGIRAVGINRVLEEAQTPIMSLYRQFGSKDGLVEAFLIDKDARLRAMFEREVDKLADNGRDKVLAMFEVQARVIAEDDFRGCTFINASVEMADASHPFVEISRAHKRHAKELFTTYLQEADVVDAEPLAAQLLMLMDGVFVAAQMRAPYDAIAHARRAVTVLIDDALRHQDGGTALASASDR